MSKTMITKREELKGILRQKNNFSFGKLKRMLDFSSDYELMCFLISYLNDEMTNFNFSSSVGKNRHLLKLVRYYNYSLGKIDLNDLDDNDLYEDIYNKLNCLYDKVICVINSNDKSYGNFNDNRNLLLKVADGIKNACLNISDYIDIDNNFDGDIYNDFFDMVFDLKNNLYLDIILKENPDLIYIKKNSRYIFDIVLDNYFNILLNKDDYYEKIYYDKLVDLFLKYDDINGNDILKNIFYKRMDKTIINLDSKIISEDKNKYILSSLNERIIKTFSDDINFSNDFGKNGYYNNIDFDVLSNLMGNDFDCDRVDLTDKFVITIDNDNAHILENAISIEKVYDKYLLTIYASDVLNAISKNSDYEKNIYFKSINDPPVRNLFGYGVCNKKFSLDEGCIRPVFAYNFLVDSDLNCISYNFERANIKVSKNLKFSDFNNEDIFNDIRVRDMINNLLEITYPDLPFILDNRVANMINMTTNGFASSFISKYCADRYLPLIYLRTDFKCFGIKLYHRSEFYDYISRFDRYEIISTIGNDGIYDENNFAINLFSPTRKVASLVNQMLVNIYFIEKHDKLDFYTHSYLESQLDKIADNINRVSQSNIDKKQDKVLKKR